MKKSSAGIIIVLFLGFIFIVGAQNTIKPPVEVTPVVESKPNLRIPSLEQIPPITPQPEYETGLRIPSLEQLSTITPLPEERPTLTIPQLQGIPSFAPQAEFIPKPQIFALRELPSVQGLSVKEYKYFNLSDFSGGLNLVDFPNKIADNEATEQTNFIWSPAGKLEPRPGFDKYNTSEITAGHKIYGLYPYYRPDGKRILLAGATTSFYADTTTAGLGTNWVTVKTGLQYEKNYYFETFKGKAIVVHEGDYPFWYDSVGGTDYIGLADSGRAGLVISGDIDGDTCYSFILTGDTKITIETRPPRPGEKARRRRTDPLLTIYDRTNVTYYETDRWVGYTLKFVNAAGTIFWYTITANIQDTIYLDGQNCLATQWNGHYYIYSYFDYKYLYGSIAIDSTIGYYCYDGIYLKNADAGIDNYVDSGIVARMWTGFSTGQERIICDVSYNAETIMAVNARFDTISNGQDSLRVYQKVFWKPRLVDVFKNRIFFVTENQYPATGQEFIVFSAYNRIGDFPPDNYIPLNFKSGEHVTALATFYDDQLGYKDRSRDCLVIFQENSIFKLVWSSATDYYLVQVTENVGCVAPRSIVNVEGKYLLFLHTTGVYAFDGRTVTLVSKKIQPTIDTLSRKENIVVSAATYHDRHYYLSYPTSSARACNETVVFNIDLGSWAEVDGMKSDLYVEQAGLSDSVKLLFVSPAWKSFIYEFGNATTDTGEAISLVYKSKAFDFNSIADRKRFTYFDFDYYLDAGNFTTYFYTDFGDSLRYNKTVSESGGYRYKRLPLDADCLGRNFSFKITSSNHLELGKVGLKFKKIGE